VLHQLLRETVSFMAGRDGAPPKGGIPTLKSTIHTFAIERLGFVLADGPQQFLDTHVVQAPDYRGAVIQPPAIGKESRQRPEKRVVAIPDLPLSRRSTPVEGFLHIPSDLRLP
jgi:hypothetical protein